MKKINQKIKKIYEGLGYDQKTVSIPFSWKDEDTDGEIVYRDFEAEVELDIVNDSDYGADADGNRGVSISYVDNFEIISVTDEDGKSVEIDETMYDIIGGQVHDYID
jgi:hypothetical protein